jgi:type I restriction enzyme S subunit
MSDFARYEAYKDSGVEWLGEIPEHWKIKKIFHHFMAKKGKNAAQLTKEFCASIEGNYPVYSGQTENNGIMSSINQYEFDAGEVGYLFTTTVGAKAMSVMQLKGRFSLSQNCMVIIPRGECLNSRFFYYQFLPMFSYYRGLIPDHMQASFRIEDLYQYKFFLPPSDEQDRIVNFLDQKTVKIDEAIAKKQRLIELLKEQKAILINQAVTKGLNSNVPMCDSCVEWIGEIPAHWQVIPNKFIFKEINERSKKGLEMHLSMSQKRGVVPATEVAKSLESESYEGAKLVFKNDLVLNRLKAHLAVFSPSSYDGLVSPDYSVFRLRNPEYQVSFFSNLFRTPIYLAELNRRVKGIVVGFLRLYSDDFNAIPSIVPPEQEQQEIVLEINRISDEVKLLTDLTEQEIEKLNEFKQTLIAHAVTGKIKV